MEDLLDLGGIGSQFLGAAGGQFGDEGMNEGVTAHGEERVELADADGGSGVQPDLLLRLPTSGRPQVGVAGFAAAAGERHLTTVRAQVRSPAGEDDGRLAPVHVERDQHRREPLRSFGRLRRAPLPEPLPQDTQIDPVSRRGKFRPRRRRARAYAGRARDVLGTTPARGGLRRCRSAHEGVPASLPIPAADATAARTASLTATVAAIRTASTVASTSPTEAAIRASPSKRVCAGIRARANPS